MHIHITFGREKDGAAGLTRRTRRFGRVALLCATAAAIGFAGGGVALANIPDAGTGVFHACANTSTGALRLVDPSKSQKCTKSETSVSWNQAGTRWRGSWSASTAYAVHDVVAYDGSSYLALAPNEGADPTSSGTDWTPIAMAGAAGSAGKAGKAGAPGIVWLGAWSATASYTPHQAVLFQGSSYVASSANTNAPPNDNLNDWVLVASAGTNGIDGEDGKTVLSGTTVPTKFIGTAGDFYIDTATDALYGPATVSCPKVLHCTLSWGSGVSLVGQRGPTGPPGPTMVYTTAGPDTILPNGDDRTLANQVLPDSGDYQVIARVQLSHETGDVSEFVCYLTAHNPGGPTVGLDQSSLTVAQTNNLGAGSIVLTGLVSLAAEGSITVHCDEIAVDKQDYALATIYTSQVSGFTTIPTS